MLSLGFQFTHPGRGATRFRELRCRWDKRFNSRTPGGVRRGLLNFFGAKHTFQFTHPGRGATNCGYPEFGDIPVSIHAPREGCDLVSLIGLFCAESFNSRTPGGVRRICFASSKMMKRFNSRTPGGVRPPFLDIRLIAKHVSIHAPREGCDFFSPLGI